MSQDALTAFHNAHDDTNRGSCGSAARRLFKEAKPIFDKIRKRPYVAIDESGTITLTALNNVIPFVGCNEVQGKGGPEKACTDTSLKNAEETKIKNTFKDLKELSAVLGVAKGEIVGLAGGHY